VSTERVTRRNLLRYLGAVAVLGVTCRGRATAQTAGLSSITVHKSPT
jgi:hypothetical protein